METWQQRAKDVMRQKKITQEKLAELVGVTQGAVAHWMGGRRNIGIDELNAIADVLCVSPPWLLYGERVAQPVAPPSVGGRIIPVISVDQADSHKEAVDSFQAGEGFLSTNIELSHYAFAMTIKDKSMHPRFVEGDQVIIDPDVTPHPGDYVAAVCRGEPKFRRYRKRGTDESGNEVFDLVPLNEDYAPLRSDKADCRIIGTMMEHRTYRRV